MTNEKLNTELYEKMFAEQEKYRGWLLSQAPEEILNHTYKYTLREDILLSLEFSDLTDAQVWGLLSSPSPLNDLFSTYKNIETNHMDDIRDCIETRANELAQALRNLPVYTHPASHARENDELELYRVSNKANIACKEALEAAISNNYRNNIVDTKTAYVQVEEQFGAERMKYVLAVTVRAKDWDGRLSNDNKAWAQTVPVVENKDAWGQDRNCYFVVDQAHTGLVDLFVTCARKQFAQEKQAPEKKPSVLGKLKQAQPIKAAPVPKKDMEL